MRKWSFIHYLLVFILLLPSSWASENTNDCPALFSDIIEIREAILKTNVSTKMNPSKYTVADYVTTVQGLHDAIKASNDVNRISALKLQIEDRNRELEDIFTWNKDLKNLRDLEQEVSRKYTSACGSHDLEPFIKKVETNIGVSDCNGGLVYEKEIDLLADYSLRAIVLYTVDKNSKWSGKSIKKHCEKLSNLKLSACDRTDEIPKIAATEEKKNPDPVTSTNKSTTTSSQPSQPKNNSSSTATTTSSTNSSSISSPTVVVNNDKKSGKSSETRDKIKLGWNRTGMAVAGIVAAGGVAAAVAYGIIRWKEKHNNQTININPTYVTNNPYQPNNFQTSMTYQPYYTPGMAYNNWLTADPMYQPTNSTQNFQYSYPFINSSDFNNQNNFFGF